MISGATSKTYWWVARIKSIKGEWSIQWVQKLKLNDTDDMDHAFFKTLSRSSSNSIIHHLIVEELHSKGIGFLKLEDETVLEKFNISPHQSTSSSRTILALHNSGNLLPISASSTTLFLACSFSSDVKVNELHITIFGSLRGKSDTDAKSLLKLGVTVDPEKNQFYIESTVDLSNKLNTEENSLKTQLMLGSILETLTKMNSLINILEQVKSTELTVTSDSFDQLSFAVDPYYKPFLLKMQADNRSAFVLEAGEGETQNVQILVRLLNREFDQSGGALLGSLKYLKEAVSIFEAIDAIEQGMKPAAEFLLQNNLRRLQFEPKFISLNVVQFVFGINSTLPSAPKKIQRDRIAFTVSFKRDRFSKNPKLLLKFSMKDNFNSQNLKFKKLFETIFTASNEVQKEALSTNQTFMKLYYDFVIDISLLKPLMIRITGAFLEFLQAP
ncbi:hypothetical protein JCM33374_g2745 [Metschnikowia sp. JCM 33374]|nr:hypothetical protein JCM33374_g2745 [Metschnikowia sp. JCM 33374]